MQLGDPDTLTLMSEVLTGNNNTLPHPRFHRSEIPKLRVVIDVSTLSRLLVSNSGSSSRFYVVEIGNGPVPCLPAKAASSQILHRFVQRILSFTEIPN